MKIVHLVDRFPDSAKYQDYYLAQSHARMGHEVVVISSNVNLFGLEDEQLFSGERVIDGFRLIRLPALFSLGHGPILLKGVADALIKEKPDIIIAHDFVYKIMALQGARYAQKNNCKFIADNHATYVNTSPRSSFYKRLYQWIHAKLVIHLLFKQTNAVVAISENSRDFLLNEYGIDAADVITIPLGVDCETFRPDFERREKIRNAWGMSRDDVVIISTGKFDESKQTHTLLKAFWQLSKKHQNIKLVLVGKSQQPGYLEKLCELAGEYSIQKSVRFLDFASSQILAEYFNGSDIAVYPGAPSISIQEAMGSGLPLILIEDTPYWKEYLSNSNGLTFKQGDVQDLAQKLDILMSCGTREKMSRLARELAERKYNWNYISRQFIDLASK